MAEITREQLQVACELGQQQLMQTLYLEAAQTLSGAELEAWRLSDFDTLSRLYMPLQETRRQVRQRAGEGTVRLDLIATGLGDQPSADLVAAQVQHGQLLVAGWGTIEPAVQLRKVARERKLFLETFLAAVFPVIGGGTAVVVVAMEDARLPDVQPRSIDALLQMVPPFSIVFNADELPKGSRKGNSETYGEVMSMWEKLHAPFLAAADVESTPVRKMEGYRKTIQVDSACELAHQKLSDIAKHLTHLK